MLARVFSHSRFLPWISLDYSRVRFLEVLPVCQQHSLCDLDLLGSWDGSFKIPAWTDKCAVSTQWNSIQPYKGMKHDTWDNMDGSRKPYAVLKRKKPDTKAYVL